MPAQLTINFKANQQAWPALALASFIKEKSESSIELSVADSGEPLSYVSVQGSKSTALPDVLHALATDGASYGLIGSASVSDAVPSETVEKILSTKDFAAASKLADDLERRLTLRSYLIGYNITAADLTTWGALKSNSIFLGILKKGSNPHLARWYAQIDSSSYAQSSIQTLQSASKANSRTKKANATFELGLPNAVHGKVVTRFPPEPSGYLHIGHAKAAILNQYFARHYDGRFIVRFDDTNPSKENVEFQDSILEDLKLLGIHGDVITYSSDYFQQIYDKAIELIKRGKAYCDDTAQEQMRDERMKGIASGRRDASVEENLARFEEMTKGTEEGTKWCLRAKISVDDTNKALRDPVIYRCNLLPHHRTGTAWKVYPTYDFCCPVVDCLEGVTHALRTNEYRDRNPQYEWMLSALDMRIVTIWDFGRINFVYTLLSKRKLKTLVERGLVRGWDDPRFPTVRGMRRRGMTIEGLRQYMLAQGPSQAFTSLEWDGIWSTNKKVIDPVVARHHAISSKDMVTAEVSGCKNNEAWIEERPRHKKNPELGNKKTTFGPQILLEQEDAQSFGDNEEVRTSKKKITLMDWGNAIVRSKEVDENGIVKNLKLDLHLEGDFRKTSKKVHWLATSKEASLSNVALLDYDYLVTKKKMEDEDSLDDVINPKTEYVEYAVADANVADLEKGTIIQFERKGYYILDKPKGAKSILSDDKEASDRLEFIAIPDGKVSSVSLKYQAQPEKK